MLALESFFGLAPPYEEVTTTVYLNFLDYFLSGRYDLLGIQSLVQCVQSFSANMPRAQVGVPHWGENCGVFYPWVYPNPEILPQRPRIFIGI